MTIDLRLNLGCGWIRVPGYINVDKFGKPDLHFDLETFPYHWDDNNAKTNPFEERPLCGIDPTYSY